MCIQKDSLTRTYLWRVLLKAERGPLFRISYIGNKIMISYLHRLVQVCVFVEFVAEWPFVSSMLE